MGGELYKVPMLDIVFFSGLWAAFGMLLGFVGFVEP